jgi:5-methylcytosine-specific restriction endonuclease McrA
MDQRRRDAPRRDEALTDRTFIPPTRRSRMSKARAARIFLAWNGRCGWCGLQIRDGEPYEIDHPTALNLGGSDDDSKLQPIHVRCHKIKTKEDKGAVAKRNRIVTEGWAGKPKGRGLRKPEGMTYSWSQRRYVRTGEATE